MISLVTFATDDMSRSAELCIESAEHNGVDAHSRYSPGNIMHCDNMREYWPAMDRMLNHPRGCGFWSWKPLIIKTDMDLLGNGDYVIYSDAGVGFLNNTRYIIDHMDQDIFLFGNNWEHAHWCKRDVVEAVWPTPQCPGENCGDMHHQTVWRVRYGKQVQASVIFFRVSNYTRTFVKEWLDWCLFEGGRLIDDSPSRLPNHPEFQEHRHDQAILTTMAYREGIKLHWWPAMYNDGAFTYEKLPCYAGDDYPVLFHHHRRRNHEWSQ